MGMVMEVMEVIVVMVTMDMVIMVVVDITMVMVIVMMAHYRTRKEVQRYGTIKLIISENPCIKHKYHINQ